MVWPFTSISYQYFLAAMVTAVTAWFAWRRRQARSGLLSLALSMLAIAVWCLLGGLEFGTPSIPAKFLFISFGNFLGQAIVIWYFVFTFEYYRRAQWLTTPWRIGLWGLPLAVLGLSLTNGWHNLIWTGFTLAAASSPLVYYAHGPVFYVAAAYQMLLLACTLGELGYCFVRRRLPAPERYRTLWLMLSTSCKFLYQIDPYIDIY